MEYRESEGSGTHHLGLGSSPQTCLPAGRFTQIGKGFWVSIGPGIFEVIARSFSDEAISGAVQIYGDCFASLAMTDLRSSLLPP